MAGRPASGAASSRPRFDTLKVSRVNWLESASAGHLRHGISIATLTRFGGSYMLVVLATIVIGALGFFYLRRRRTRKTSQS